MDTATLVNDQRVFFESGATLAVGSRLSALRRLRAAIDAMEPEILAALGEDLGKSPTEGYMTEVGMARSELTYFIKNLPALMKKRRVPTPPAQLPARSYRLPVPRGVTLIMSPWNYPFLLTIEPLTAALAAGNTAVVKPSDYAPATAAVVKKLLEGVFHPGQVAVVTGGRAVNADLLEQRFDYIFFTGSKAVGRLVMEKAAAHLCPVTLELGGKSPCIVDETAKIPLAARRIVFGKFLNAGQTCVAPDYILVEKSVKAPLLAALKKEIVRQFGQNPLDNPAYGKIINKKHFDRLCAMVDGEESATGGLRDGEALRMAPVLVPDATLAGPAMAEEIFGPVLPILTYDGWEELRGIISANPTPLALYVFSARRPFIRRLQQEIPFGGGCVNDVVVHLATTAMPFGGMGESGMGAYHGKAGFDTFSHYKSILDKAVWFDMPLRYQPYTAGAEKLIRRFLK